MFSHIMDVPAFSGFAFRMVLPHSCPIQQPARKLQDMKTLIKELCAPFVVAAAISLVGTGLASAACLDNRQIQEAVSSGEIMSLAQVLSSAGVGSSAEVLNVQVCDEGGRLVYIIGVLTPDGEAQNLVLSAN
jgi:uncharacterized membrane protein YkoI